MTLLPLGMGGGNLKFDWIGNSVLSQAFIAIDLKLSTTLFCIPAELLSYKESSTGELCNLFPIDCNKHAIQKTQICAFNKNNKNKRVNF